MNVRIQIVAECQIQSATDMDFGTEGVLAANVDQTSTITVVCTNGTPYSIGLGAGAGAGATVAIRRMTGPAAATVDYSLFRNNARSLVWGDTIGTNTVAATGNGSAQAHSVYGRVPPQGAPAPGLYTDIVAITVTY